MKDYYQLGVDAFNSRKASYYDDSDLRNVGINQDEWMTISSDSRGKFIDGFCDAREAYLKPHWQPAYEKLKQFEKDNNFRVSTGCGCCGGGYYITIDGVEYDFYPEEEDD